MANELQLVFEKLSNQARFIKMIVDRKLTISNRKRADIVAELRRLEFRPFPKQKAKKRPGEVEVLGGENEEEEEMSGGAGDYDYLLSMSISSLTTERVSLNLSFTERCLKLILIFFRWKNFLKNVMKERKNLSIFLNLLLMIFGIKILMTL